MKLKSLLDFNDDGDRRPMTQEDADMFMKATFMDMDGMGYPEEIPHSPGLEIFLSRLPEGVSVSFPAALFLATLCRNPGEAVVWAYTCCHICEKNDIDEVTMGSLTDEFPDGFPTDQGMRKCWNAQKDGESPMGNGMDVAENWKLGV